MKTVITLAVAFILGLSVAVTTIGCGGEKKAPAPAAGGATEKPADKPADAPADKPADKPADEKAK